MTASLAVDDIVLTDFAAEVGDEGPVAIVGARTRWEIGGPSAAGTRLLAAPSGIVDYKPEEMIVRVRVGTTVAELDAALAQHGQRSALPDRGGTVGGALSVGENDPRALGRGLLRNAVLQLRYVSAEGRLITSGGPTVKNVTGFDLPRLLVGSLGTLGLLAEAIVRTNPVPAVSRWLRSDDAEPDAAYRAVLAPTAVLWDGTSTWIELEGHEVDVDAAVRALGTVGTFADADGPPPLPPHRWSLPPAEVLTLDEGRCGRFVAAVGLGLAWADNAAPRPEVPPATRTVARRLKDNFDPTGRLNPGRDPYNA